MNVNTRPTRRMLSALLALVLVLSLLPVSALAAGGETIRGDAVTVELAQSGALQRENNFNDDWKFYLGTSSNAQEKSFNDSSWENVTLPHDFSIFQNFTTSGEAESGFLPGGTGWYRKTFTLPESAAGKTILINFDGVYSDAYVYVNGELTGEHHYGYTSFAVDLSDKLVCDGVTENVIAVKAVNNIPSSRWYSGSGIYRDVTLYVMDPVHVDRYGMTVTTPDVSNSKGTVQVETDVVNDGTSAAQVTVTGTVYKKDSDQALASASTTVTVAAGSTATATVSPVVSSYELWQLDDPDLYTVKTTLTVDGTETDTAETDFGFRWFSFDSQGFHLNGTNVKLNGVCMHHDQGALGSAAYYDAMYRQLSILKDMGVNAIRTAHNPADEDYIAICNELGLLVIEESFDGLMDAKNGNSNDFSKYFESSVDTKLYGASSSMTCAEYAARNVISRDKNAPSIIAWSFGNEIQEGTYWTNVSSYASTCANFISWANDEDGTRPVTSGDNNRGGDTRLVNVLTTITNNNGVVGFNYVGSTSDITSLKNKYAGSKGCIILSETSSATNSRSVYSSQANNSNADGKYHLTSYDTSAVSWGMTAHESLYNTYQYDYAAGEFVWTGFDYIGEPTPWNGTGSGSVSGSGAYPNSSYFGIVETTGFEKDTYYLYRSQWNKSETTLHLVTAWDSDNMMTTSGKTPVWVYSNAPTVKLYRDGTLIGTATRTAHTSSAGHTYYTYTTTSNNSVCTTSSGSGSSALYAVFNVTYASGTISAKAYDESGNEIKLSGNSGKNTVSTPDTAAQLVLSQNKTEIAADGSSLVYVTVDVTDASGNLDTTASNSISFSLEGAGEIVGVDNGDQATTAKYQQSSVLTSSTTANIKAYAGKALVILRSTKDAGTMTLNVTSSGLTGGAVTVQTKAVQETAAEGLTGYSMVKDYTVKCGTQPTLDTTVTGTLAGGSEISGTIAWENLSSETWQTAGDYTLSGTLTFDGYDAIAVTARLHVIGSVVALRNVSTATSAGTMPTLPNVVSGVLADGTLSGEFAVTWDSVSAEDLDTVGDTVTVNGTATVFGNETLPVTCTIRVAQEEQTDSTNIAPQAETLTQDIDSSKQSDTLSSIINGTTKPGDNTSERWTNYNNRTTSADVTLTLAWATAHMISSVNLYYYDDNYCSATPERVAFHYSLNGSDYTEIEATEELIEEYSLGAEYTYTFAKPINPISLQVTLTQQNGTNGSKCVGLTELEVMTYQAQLEYNSTAALSAILVDGTALTDFAADTRTYEAAGSTVTAASDANVAVTILPEQDGVVRILTLSEDATESRLYAVTLGAACEHANTELRNAADATCTTDGSTGDTYCKDCGKLILAGTVIPATGHLHTEIRNAKDADCVNAGYTGDTWCTDCKTLVASGKEIPATGHLHTEIRNAKDAACETEGYTGDTYCTDCSTIVSSGKTISALGHKWDDGVIKKEATEDEDGIRLYTCSTCGATKEEAVAYKKALKVPSVTVKMSKNSSGKIVLTGQMEDYENLEDYYPITDHGFVYKYTYLISNSEILSLNSYARTRVYFKKFKTDGSFVYNMKPTNRAVSYSVRAYITYKNTDTGKTHTVYSDICVGSYNSLK